MTHQETLDFLFDKKPHILRPSLSAWMKESARFTDFLATHQTKIRKKIKTQENAGSGFDLLAELEVAYLLLQEKRFTVEYEPYHKATGRSPDFAVTFKTHTTFNVEVTRLRLSNREDDDGDSLSFDQQREGMRLADNVSSKLGQMLPSMMNLLVVMADHEQMNEIEIGKVMNKLKQRGEQKDEHLFRRHRFRSGSDFFKKFARLSAILIRKPGDVESEISRTLWQNKLAKHPLLSPVCTILLRA